MADAASANITVINNNQVSTVGYGEGQPAAPQIGICALPFRLPIGGAAPTILGNGSNQETAAATTTNEFSKLDVWMGGTGADRYFANTYPNFTTDNIANPQLFFVGALSGGYGGGLSLQGSLGYWWSSMANSDARSYVLNLYSGGTSVTPSNHDIKDLGFAVRCVL